VLILTQRVSPASAPWAEATLALTAEERSRSRHRFASTTGEAIYLDLPRGTVLQDGDWLQGHRESDSSPVLVNVIAKPEPVLTVTTEHSLALLKAAYHLGNRHVALEVTTDYLRLTPDPVLKAMLEQLGLTVVEEMAPFQPEAGAYGHTSHRAEAHSH
jgi:urease accessory protein